MKSRRFFFFAHTVAMLAFEDQSYGQNVGAVWDRKIVTSISRQRTLPRARALPALVATTTTITFNYCLLISVLLLFLGADFNVVLNHGP